MLNLANRREKNKYQNETILQMIKLERIGAREITPILNKQYRNAAKLVKEGTYNINFPVNEQGERLYSTLYKHYKRVALSFTKRTDQELGKDKSILPVEVKKKIEGNSNKNKYWLAIFLFIRKNSRKVAEEMNQTTKNIIQRIINRGFREGKDNQEIAKILVETGLISNPRRALRAATTETHSIANFSINESIKQQGIADMKEWLTAKDEKVRVEPFNHVAAEGETVGINDMFVMTGEPMEYPGDPNGSPGNILSCRCLAHYITSSKSARIPMRKNTYAGGLR